MHRVAGARWLEQHRGSARTSVQVDNTDVAARTVASGVGIGVIPRFVEIGLRGVVRIFPKPVATTTGFIVYHETVRETARVRAGRIGRDHRSNRAMFDD
jgi:DNA-binding transcriptional LysR family regulator